MTPSSSPPHATRSVPYYEVPAPRAYSIREAHRVREEEHHMHQLHQPHLSSSSSPPSGLLPPRPPSAVGTVVTGATQTTATAATTGPMAASVAARRPPYTYIDQDAGDGRTIQSRLV